MTPAPCLWVWAAGLPSDTWPCCSLAEPLDLEDLSSGLGMTKPDLGQGKGPCRGHRAPAAYPLRGRIPHGQRAGVA